MEQEYRAAEEDRRDRACHYLGSAIWFTRVGHAMGEAMLELMKKQGK